jgi:hypothetical protein
MTGGFKPRLGDYRHYKKVNSLVSVSLVSNINTEKRVLNIEK